MKTIQEMGKYQQKRRYVIGLIIVVLIFALLFIRSSWYGHMHEYIEAFGLGFIVFAIIGRLWCTLYIGGRKSAEIVAIGPYSISRNPLYVFSAIGAIGIGAQTGSIVLALIMGFLCYIAFLRVILVEEKFLQGNFGEPYQQYCQKVPRFFPKFSLFHDANELIVKPDRLYRTFSDGLVFFIAYPVFEFIEYLQDSNILPVLFHMY
ncbi:isoprenylcysteine carboxylmethyltransferase family protein (plasmid) [Bartonella sp. HY329]|uniref:methyltransferase family protein n=1 Tax=unclassified Bartonella TaxID=2645622 RepID=UPI0021C715EC|nr:MULTISPECIES: isoprenylcysteine carboxylmethyltransferase family protein [unclassified Bartonella]UXM96526.1 isoprenylcysteine carboxylmethyltransferase family protein [Bartonella sp. HY329]UXN10849.1 isoprenylcysteine carboxylmethyltransferase family protein [Bartonella sp. HY328]